MNENVSRLSQLIRDRQADIIDEWKTAAARLPRAQHLDEPLLLDHMPQMLEELSTALIHSQNRSIIEMSAHKSAKQHGEVRYQLGFDVEEVIAEFGLLRDTVQRFAETSSINISGEVNRTVNRVIDKAIAVSLETYVQQQTQEVKRKRQEYLSFIVHDLKTPISAIVTAAHVIDRKFGGEKPADPVMGKMINILRRNAFRLNQRVLEIINEESRLQALTADSHQLPLERRDIDLWPIVERLKNDCQSIADAQRNTMRNEVSVELRLYADPDLVVEVLQNLLSNALKYTTDGEISIGGEENSTSTVCWIKDTGIGIPPEQLQRIFQKGTVDPTIPGSTGLGLAVVEKVMRLHGGNVSVDSTPGAGTTFRVEFPKRESEAA
jgi:two-component system, OmpR family, phosphate regulon sensor histidine kinase PhoR